MRIFLALLLTLSLSRATPEQLDLPVGHVAVLMYHHLAPPSEREEEPGVITPDRFEQHLQLLRDEGYRLITAEQFAAFRDGRLRLPGRSVLITFDDGYESNYTFGYPLLQKYSAPALIFPVMIYFESNGQGAWSPHLTTEQVAEMRQSGRIAFGGHSYDGHGFLPAGPGLRIGPWLTTRAWLPDLGRQETPAEYLLRIRQDIGLTRDWLLRLGVQDDALHFALPNGASTPEELDELRTAGFRYIYSTDNSRLNRPGDDLIYRIDAGSPHASPAWLREKLRTLFQHAEGQE